MQTNILSSRLLGFIMTKKKMSSSASFPFARSEPCKTNVCYTPHLHLIIWSLHMVYHCLVPSEAQILMCQTARRDDTERGALMTWKMNWEWVRLIRRSSYPSQSDLQRRKLSFCFITCLPSLITLSLYPFSPTQLPLLYHSSN